jgi:hypothetical protein
MKLYKGEFKSYSITELSDGAKDNAYKKWLNKDSFMHSAYEAEAALKEFCKIFDIKMRSWSYDSYSYNCDFRIDNNTLEYATELGLSGIRLATYIWNNYARYITKGKCYSLWSKTEKNERNPSLGKLKTRYSNVMTEMDNYPLTGVCYDYYILAPIIDCLTYKTFFNNYEELIEQCLENLFDSCVADCKYYESIEFFVDEAQTNEFEYDEKGNAFYLPTGFVDIA